MDGKILTKPKTKKGYSMGWCMTHDDHICVGYLIDCLRFGCGLAPIGPHPTNDTPDYGITKQRFTIGDTIASKRILTVFALERLTGQS